MGLTPYNSILIVHVRCSVSANISMVCLQISMQKEVSECRAMSRLELESMQRQMAARQEDVEDAQRQSTAYYNTLEVRGKSSKPSLLLFKGGLFDNMYHL